MNLNSSSKRSKVKIIPLINQPELRAELEIRGRDGWELVVISKDMYDEPFALVLKDGLMLKVMPTNCIFDENNY